MEKDSHSDDEIKKFYTMKNIAVVGMSKNEEKAAHYVPRYLIDHGYNVIPVNPTATEILGRKSYPAVSSRQNRHRRYFQTFRRCTLCG
jgi:predicted CoA-binding protein